MTHTIPTEQIKAAAINQIVSIANQLAPDMASIEGRRRWSLNPTRPDTAPNSFCVDVSGATAGRFKEFASGHGGDVIDFVSYCLGGSAGYQSRERRGQALRWLRQFLGLGSLNEADRAALAEQARRRDEARGNAEHEAKAQRLRRAKLAREMWLAAKPWPGTLVEAYLSEGRKIPMRQLVDGVGSPLNAIRFCPEVVCGVTGACVPAMLTAFTRKGQITGVHTTFLAEDGRGKADLGAGVRVKRFLGDVRGAAMRLTRGETGKPEGEAPARGDVLAVAEGIENALSWACLYPAHRTFAAGSVDLVGQVELPACAGRIVMLRDNDEPGSPADGAARKAAKALSERADGRPVSVQAPPPEDKDFNDYWKRVQ